MAKMKIASSDRVRVRLECLRLLRTLKLDPARSQLIWGFVETYLTLNAEEMRRYERATAQLTSAEQLDDPGEALLDFATITDLDQWLAQHPGTRALQTASV